MSLKTNEDNFKIVISDTPTATSLPAPHEILSITLSNIFYQLYPINANLIRMFTSFAESVVIYLMFQKLYRTIYKHFTTFKLIFDLETLKVNLTKLLFCRKG